MTLQTTQISARNFSRLFHFVAVAIFFTTEAGRGESPDIDTKNYIEMGEVTLSEIGSHYPIFFVEKSENPQNILVAYTKLDGECNLSKVDGKPLLDYYWLMDRKKYKPVHPLIKSGIRDRLKLAVGVRRESRAFSIQMTDLNELKHDLGVATVDVLASSKDESCHVAATIKLGPSDGGRIIKLTSLFTESSKTILPPFRKVNSVTLSGSDLANAHPMKRQYFAK